MRKILLALVLVAFPLQALAWGAIGHRTVGLVAQSRLTPEAAAAVQRLLGTETLASVASWADQVRGDGQYKQSIWYHFEKIPDSVAYLKNLEDMADWQKKKGGIVTAILAGYEVLKENKAPAAYQTDALKFLVHFVGDVHQPFHTGRPQDSGGVRIMIDWLGEPMSLHRVWDSGMMVSGHSDFISRTKTVRENAFAYSRYLNRVQPGKNASLALDVEGWLNESMSLRGPAYNPIYETDQLKYQKLHLPEVDERIFVAGLRLAAMLNDIYSPTAKPPAAQDDLKRKIEAIVGPIQQLISFSP